MAWGEAVSYTRYVENTPAPPRRRAGLLLAFACGLGLRWGVSVVTEFRPLFPRYSTADARMADRKAALVAEAWREGSGTYPWVEPTRRVFVAWLAALYALFGHHPLIPKLLNGLLSMAAALVWRRIALLSAGPRAATATFWLLCLWPTNVFYASQNFREPMISLSSALALYLPLAHWAAPAGTSAWRIGAASLMFLWVGFFRAPLMLLQGLSLIPAALWSTWSRPRLAWRTWAPILAFALAALAYRPAARLVFDNLLSDSGALREIQLATRARPLPVARVPDGAGGRTTVSPLTPEGLTLFRRTRHQQDQAWARKAQGRRIRTQLFPDAEFSDWGDVAAFLPKSVFYVLFMPLPGLYPLEGNLSRALAAAENVALLGLAILAFLGFRRARGPAVWTLAAFFAAAALSYGLFEFDLGAATRHKLLYFPCLFPFAALASHFGVSTQRRACSGVSGP